ncbi:MAG: proliferating cell nuclear antigen (pcna) [Thermoplasmatota archaeon]
MFKARLKADVLKDVITVVGTLVEEVKLNVSSEGISLRAVDPAHVAMVELSLKAGAFEELKASACELGVDIEKFREILKLARAGSVIKLNHDEDKNKLVVSLENLTRRMSLVDTAGMSDPKVPNVNLPAKVIIKTEELGQGIRASESISDHIALIATPEYFELSAEGETDSVSLKLPRDLLEVLETKDTVKSLFSLDYFSNMIKSVGATPTVNLNLGTDYPVRIEFDIAGGEGHVKYLLAPRIENE